MSCSLLIGCRVCLSTEPSRSFFSLEDSMEFLMVSQVLGLQEDFSHLNIYPNHLCGQCKQTVNSYKAFKEEALRNEIFLVKCQADIKRIGLEKR